MIKTKEELQKDGLIVAQSMGQSGNPGSLVSLIIASAYGSGFTNGYNSRDEEVKELVDLLRLAAPFVGDADGQTLEQEKEIEKTYGTIRTLLTKYPL